MKEQIRGIIREITDPAEFRRQMEKLLEEEQDPPIFVEGDEMPLHAFLDLFKKTVCDGNETRFWQWKGRIVCLAGGELGLALGTSLTGKSYQKR